MSDDLQQVANELGSTLNRHGFAFQAAVLEEVRRIGATGASQFYFEVAEFPVQVGSSNTRIDFVLRHQRRFLVLVSECKRANPAFANWCFARMPYLRRNDDPEWPMMDKIRRDRGEIFYVKAVSIGPSPPTPLCHLAFEVKSQRKGDSSSPKSTAAIEEAATQVSRGTNGLIEFYLRDPSLLKGIDEIWLLPVVFTTSDVWFSDVDLRQTDVATGEILSDVALHQVSWLLYQYHISPSLKHVTRFRPTSAELAKALENEFLRSIAIVSPSGIDEFLRWASNLWES